MLDEDKCILDEAPPPGNSRGASHAERNWTCKLDLPIVKQENIHNELKGLQSKKKKTPKLLKFGIFQISHHLK